MEHYLSLVNILYRIKTVLKPFNYDITEITRNGDVINIHYDYMLTKDMSIKDIEILKGRVDAALKEEFKLWITDNA